MRFKRFRKMCLTLSVLLGSVTISSCSAFFGSDEFMITSIDKTTNENGDIVLTMHFSDSEKEPLVLTIPSGLSGKDGVGIASIETELNVDNTEVRIIISYTDDSLEPTIISVPITKGQDGKGIKDVIIDKDDEGNTTFKFVYTDDTESELFTINKGQDGIGILEIENTENIDGSVTITIHYTDGSTSEPFTINPPVGILTITESEIQNDNDYYLFDVYYTDGTKSPIKIPKPRTTQWYSGNTVPSASLGYEGDFYVVITTGELYKKNSNNEWEYLFSIKGTGADTYYKVTFNLNGGKWVNGRYSNPESQFEDRVLNVKYGTYINLMSSDLECEYEDNIYTFDGWWTDAVINPNSGHFTSLTPVFGDLTLYAKWK